jgi:2-haloacid dehalogenase
MLLAAHIAPIGSAWTKGRKCQKVDVVEWTRAPSRSEKACLVQRGSSMAITRREFVRITAGVAAANVATRSGLQAADEPAPLRVKAVAFDAFPIFSPAQVLSRANDLFPGRGGSLVDEWRVRQFEYGWLRVLSRRYVDFWRVTQDALVFAARKLKLELDSSGRDALMSAFVELSPWPDAAPALASLATSGLRLGFLSNFTARMLEANIERSGLRARFERVLSTDRARTYKPDPRAYQLGTEAFGLRREEILFVAHAGWDAAGARVFGYPTFWVNRSDLPAEELGALPDAAGHDLSDLVRFVEHHRADGGRR